MQQCNLASRNSYKMLAKRLFQLYSIAIWYGYNLAQESYSGLNNKIGISRNTKYDNLVSFPKSGHIYIVIAECHDCTFIEI